MSRLFKLMTMPSAWQVSDLDFITADLRRDFRSRSARGVLDPIVTLSVVGADLSCAAIVFGVVLGVSMTTRSHIQPSLYSDFWKVIFHRVV